MAISIAGVIRDQPVTRTEALKELKSTWWRLRRSVDRRQMSQIIPRLDEVERVRRDHSLTFAEMLVGSGCVR